MLVCCENITAGKISGLVSISRSHCSCGHGPNGLQDRLIEDDSLKAVAVFGEADHIFHSRGHGDTYELISGDADTRFYRDGVLTHEASMSDTLKCYHQKQHMIYVKV